MTIPFPIIHNPIAKTAQKASSHFNYELRTVIKRKMTWRDVSTGILPQRLAHLGWTCIEPRIEMMLRSRGCSGVRSARSDDFLVKSYNLIKAIWLHDVTGRTDGLVRNPDRTSIFSRHDDRRPRRHRKNATPHTESFPLVSRDYSIADSMRSIDQSCRRAGLLMAKIAHSNCSISRNKGNINRDACSHRKKGEEVIAGHRYKARPSPNTTGATPSLRKRLTS